ncbi:MAG TPA: Rap1a/Tai family immunity protein [Rhizomicrobium sp.]|nr:Rap1a/Tai family immunity protein [Rhizomicrobium sp.]
MNRHALSAPAALLLFCMLPAWGQDEKGQGESTTDPGFKASALRDACDPPVGAGQAEKDDGDRLCQAYLRGVADGLFLSGALHQSGAPICLPQDGPISPSEAKDELKDYLAGHPEAANRSAGMAAALAIIAAHPCE